MVEVYAEERPWCNGRVYPNASPIAKVWCLVRPPPWWWLVECTGFTGLFTTMNGVRLFRLWRAAAFMNPWVQWTFAHSEEGHEVRQVVQWQAIAGSGYNRHLDVNLDPIGNGLQQIIFSSPNVPPESDWMSWDGVELPESYRSPLWDSGASPTCKVWIGTYDKLPVNSCRGDYNGPFPSP